METKKNEANLSRYFPFEHLENCLCGCKLYMGDYSKWPDKNDVYCLEEFKKAECLKELRVLCFTKSTDRINFWDSYGGTKLRNPDCIRLVFDGNQIRGAFCNQANFLHGDVQYSKFSDLESKKKSDLPFLKRFQFKSENEYRIISKNDQSYWDFPKNSLKKIILSPYLSGEQVKTRKKQVKCWLRLYRFCNVDILHSQANQSRTWATKISQIATNS